MDVPQCGIVTETFLSAKDKLTRFLAISLSSGEMLFTESVGNLSADIGGFLGIVASVRYLLEHPEISPVIYSDNLTAIMWFHNKKAVSSRHNPTLHKAEVFLHIFSTRIGHIRVLYWDKHKWGNVRLSRD